MSKDERIKHSGDPPICSAKSSENILARSKLFNSLSRITDKNSETDFVQRKKKTSKSSSLLSERQEMLSRSSPNLFEVISPRDEKWIMVQEALTNSLLGKNVADITEVLCCVRELTEQTVANMMVDFYETQILRNTLHKIQKRMTTISDIADCWVTFYRKSLPNINLIFYSLKTQQELIENLSLFEFKRRVVKIENLRDKITGERKNTEFVWNDFINMVLVLLPIRKKDDIYTDVDATFEEVAALLISPLIGCQGVYVNGVLIQSSKEAPIVVNATNSLSRGIMNKGRKTIQGLFNDSKSLLDISGDF